MARGLLLVGLLMGVLVPLGAGAQTTLGTETLTSPNPENGGYFGESLAGVGDVTGDGTPDLFVGALGESAAGRSDTGRVYQFDVQLGPDVAQDESGSESIRQATIQLFEAVEIHDVEAARTALDNGADVNGVAQRHPAGGISMSILMLVQ